MTNYREILRLYNLGLNKTQIAEICGYSRNTVAQTIKQAEANGLKHPLPEGMSDTKLAEIIRPNATLKIAYKMPDYAYIAREMLKSNVTLNLLWLEYAEECKENGEIPYQLTQFKKYYRDYMAKTGATMHLDHKPGEVMQVDWAGDTASIIDTDTGERIPVYIFVATLPFSGYSYVEGFLSMNQECWTEAHVNAYKYFGGVAKIIQCDNLKTGVDKHGKNEIKLNKSYAELAEHYNTAILPCRVRAPKDKAMVEGTVGVISTFILAALRNREFLSLPELNEAISERLYQFNHKPFQKKDGSRAALFQEEKLFLMPLPLHPYELSTWKIATVAPNYHISLDKMNYSVPFEYIKKKVDVRLTKNTVEVFFDGNRICSHRRLYGRANQYSTNEEHMPPNHQKYVQWNGDRFIKWAAKIGSSTKMVVTAILNGYKVEQQGYKSILSVLLILSILAGAMTLGVTPAAAVSKPTLYAPVNINGGQRLTWSNVGALRYYLYFGVYDYNTRKQEWRVYREVRDTSFEITYNSLHSSGWKIYLNYKPTPQLTSGQVYCYQVHAGKINSAGRPVDKNYSSVRTMTYLKAPYLNYSIDGNQICIGGYSEGANGYQYRYKKESWNAYHYGETITPGYISWIYDATYSDKCIYEARAVLQTKNNGTAYSAWVSFKLP